MYRNIVYFFCFCFLISCRVTRQEVKKTQVDNSIISEKKTSYKDTIIFSPKAETSLKIPVHEIVFKDNLKPNLKPRIYTQKNGNATAKLKILNDSITLTATCDSLAIVAKIKHELYKESYVSKTIDSQNLKQTRGFSFWNLTIAFLLGFSVCFILKLFKII
jgi:hypothetical protein